MNELLGQDIEELSLLKILELQKARHIQSLNTEIYWFLRRKKTVLNKNGNERCEPSNYFY